MFLGFIFPISNRRVHFPFRRQFKWQNLHLSIGNCPISLMTFLLSSVFSSQLLLNLSKAKHGRLVHHSGSEVPVPDCKLLYYFSKCSHIFRRIIKQIKIIAYAPPALCKLPRRACSGPRSSAALLSVRAGFALPSAGAPQVHRRGT